jgi:nucleoside-diphosphate-sugar epimerase
MGSEKPVTMRVFVTGASGFVGAHLVPILLNAGCKVAILAVRDDTIWRLKEVINRITVIHGELGAINEFAADLNRFRPDICIHLAWYVEPGKYLDSPLNINWIMNSVELLTLLIEIGCRQVVMTGTCAEYDTEFGYLKETSPTKPATLYAAAKLSLCMLGEQIVKGTETRLAWARLFYLYGAKEDDRRLVPALIRALLRNESFAVSSGEQTRDYLHVEDVASALWFIAEQNLEGTFNISSGVPITMRALMEMIGDILEKRELIQFDALPKRNWEPPFICGDNRKLRQLGWHAKYSLADGLRETISWWKKA